MLALARALAVSPKLVIADEMSLGLAPIVTESVFQGLEEARKSGITIVLTEQFVHRALAMSDACVILMRGEVGWYGPAGEAGQEVIDRYLGVEEIRAARRQIGRDDFLVAEDDVALDQVFQFADISRPVILL